MGLVLGWSLGDRTPAADPVRAAVPATPPAIPGVPAEIERATDVPDAEPIAAGAPCAERVATLAQRAKTLAAGVAVQRRWIDDLALDTYGAPIPWTDAVPEKYRPEAFEAVLRDGIAECTPGSVIENLDCSEAPCIAQIRFPSTGSAGRGSIVRCAPWAERYGTASSMSSSTVECPDGTEERVLQLSPPMTELLDALGPGADANWSRRFTTRHNALRGRWVCANEQDRAEADR